MFHHELWNGQQMREGKQINIRTTKQKVHAPVDILDKIIRQKNEKTLYYTACNTKWMVVTIID